MTKSKIPGKSRAYLVQFRHLKEYIVLSGLKLKPIEAYIILYILSAVIDLTLLFWIIYAAAEYELIFAYVVIISILMLTLGYILIFLVLWLTFLLILDYLKFKRRLAVEEVLPEFLRLVAANHRAGLPLDMSLWKANKPRFGILCEEINEVARKTYGSGNLIRPLESFGTKYDSALLRRVVSNLVEGIKTGADISALLDDISNNVTTIKNTRKDLASEVENYMLFITIAVLIISPLMFGLTYKMTGLIEAVKNTLAESLGGGQEMSLPQTPLNLESASQDFRYYFEVFVYLMIATNSIVSVLLMSFVKYGNVKQELKRIPVFYIVGLTVYLISRTIFSNLLVSL